MATTFAYSRHLILVAFILSTLRMSAAEGDSTENARIQFSIYTIESKSAADGSALWRKFTEAQQPVELLTEVLASASSGNITIKKAYGGTLESANTFFYSSWTPAFRLSRLGSDVTLSETDSVGISLQLEKMVIHMEKDGEGSIQGQASIRIKSLGKKAPLVGNVIIAASDDVPTNTLLSIDMGTAFAVPANGRSYGFFIGLTDCVIYFCQMNVVK
jgi:hypothetical protein